MTFQDDFIQGQNEELIEYMKSSRLFSHIPDSLLSTLVPISDLRVYDPEQEILVEGQENDRVFFLMRGAVQIFAGGEFILELKRQGDLFGEMSVISSKPASATVIAKTRVQVFSVLGRNIGRYTDIDVERINHILYRLFAAVLTDKLALTTYKAKQYEVVNIYLNKTQAALAEKHTQLLKEKKAAEAAANTKAAFIATMSHEIRTPLNGILGMTELLLSTHQTEEQRDFTESILISGRNLLSIINDILDFSKMEEEDIQVEVKPIRLQELVEECIALSAPDAALKGLELFERIDPKTPEEIKGDPKRIAQVLNNLLSNAVKFTDQGQVQLLVKPLEGREGGELLFEVKDTGIGIAQEKQVELFQPFYQVDSSITRRHGGTGLGLVIAKNLVELMDGRIWFESLPGVGTQFYVSLPFEPLPKPDAQEFSLPKGLSLALFERGIEQGEALEERLKRWGVQVKRVREREELGILLASSDLIDLVLLSITGSTTEAHKLGQEVWSYPDREQTPIIFTTKLGQELDLSRYQQPCKHLYKPIRERSLYHAVTELLRAHTGESKSDWSENLQELYPLRILVAEDNQINQKMLLRLLSRLGYAAEVANNGKEVLEAAKLQEFDLVLMDIQMPEMDGLQAAQALRHSYKKSCPHLIALTANVFEEDKQRYLDGGLDDFIGKPISPKLLEEKIRQLGQKLFSSSRPPLQSP